MIAQAIALDSLEHFVIIFTVYSRRYEEIARRLAVIGDEIDAQYSLTEAIVIIPHTPVATLLTRLFCRLVTCPF